MKKKIKLSHAGFGYRDLQKENSRLRLQLTPESQSSLRASGYCNIGWPKVIALFDRINQLLEVEQLAELDLESLFLEADRVGNKYQSPAEIQEFQEAMANEAVAIAEIIDRTWPDPEPTSIDFSDRSQPKRWRRSGQSKTYQTTKV